LSNLADIPVLTLEVGQLDFLANDEDLDLVIGQIEEALQDQRILPRSQTDQRTLLEQGRLATYQQFHKQLDDAQHFDPDIFFNYILLTEEMGELAKELVKVWGDGKKLASDGRTIAEARQEAINKHRASLRSELADLLAYIIKLANYTGVDLEQAYLDKMRHNINRDWQGERILPR
jgi:NTP pyrophosphatase (non-canonical NTP hydrolase)